jgi:hypothetical protein
MTWDPFADPMWARSAKGGPLREAGSDDHFYGAWHGGSKGSGGHPAAGGGKAALDPKAMDAAIDGACTKVRNLKDHEEAYILADDGSEVLHKGGGASNVDFDDAEARLLENAHVVHNHPNGWGISDGDVESAVRDNVASVTAVGTLDDGTRYRYSLYRPDNGWPPKFGKTYWKAENITAWTMEADLDRRVGRIFDPAAADAARVAGYQNMARNGHHESMLAAVQKAKDAGYDIRYERTKW